MKHLFAISAYRESPYLEECIRSLLSQKEKSEVILCTSTPSDYLRKLAFRYGIPFFVRDGMPSLRDDWNFCLGKAAELGADLVTVAHQDDVYLPEYAQEVMEIFRKYEGGLKALVVCTGAGNIDGDSRTLPGEAERIKRILRRPLRYPVLNRSVFWKKMSLSFGNSIPCPSCTYHIGALGSEIFTSEYRFVIDWDTLLRIAERKGRIVCIEKPLVKIRLHDGAETARTIRDGERPKEEYEIFRRLHRKPVADLLMHYYRKAGKIYEKST